MKSKEETKGNKKLLILLATVLMLAATLTIGYFVLSKTNSSDGEQEAAVSSESDSPDSGHEWLTYENSELGFAFSYPNEYGEVSVSSSYGFKGYLSKTKLTTIYFFAT